MPIPHEGLHEGAQVLASVRIPPGFGATKTIAPPRRPFLPHLATVEIETNWEGRCNPSSNRERQGDLQAVQSLLRLCRAEGGAVDSAQLRRMSDGESVIMSDLVNHLGEVGTRIQSHRPCVILARPSSEPLQTVSLKDPGTRQDVGHVNPVADDSRHRCVWRSKIHRFKKATTARCIEHVCANGSLAAVRAGKAYLRSP
jgi:hypothetical protein